MPVRSSTSSVLRWPERDRVLAAAREYARDLVAADPGVVRVGVFGSYARGAAGPGSDLDLLVEMSVADPSPAQRYLALPQARLPVPVDLVILTSRELADRRVASRRWEEEVFRRVVWLAAR